MAVVAIGLHSEYCFQLKCLKKNITWVRASPINERKNETVRQPFVPMNTNLIGLYLGCDLGQ